VNFNLFNKAKLRRTNKKAPCHSGAVCEADWGFFLIALRTLRQPLAATSRVARRLLV